MDDSLGKGIVGVRECSRQAGVTYLESLMAVTILALLVGLAAPSLARQFVSATRDGSVAELRAALFLTRTEAIKRYTSVRMCRTLDLVQCSGTSQSGVQAWEKALVFVDIDNDRQYDSDSEILVETVEFSDRASITWNRGESIGFDADGTAGSNSNGSFSMTFSDGVADCQVVVSRLGRVRHDCD